MTTISEAELAVSVQSKVVRSFTIKETAAGRYRITVELTWRKGQLKLVTARKTVREWASLDRLVAHIHEMYGTPPPINLILYDEED
jgi:hypothetical protein